MRELPSLEKLTLSFSKLPGVGSKSAERMAYAVLRMDEEDRATFASAIEEVGAKISKCPTCGLTAKVTPVPVATMRSATTPSSASSRATATP